MLGTRPGYVELFMKENLLWDLLNCVCIFLSASTCSRTLLWPNTKVPGCLRLPNIRITSSVRYNPLCWPWLNWTHRQPTEPGFDSEFFRDHWTVDLSERSNCHRRSLLGKILKKNSIYLYIYIYVFIFSSIIRFEKLLFHTYRLQIKYIPSDCGLIRQNYRIVFQP